MPNIKTCLWFDFGQGEQAAEFYASVFKDAKVGKTARYPEGAPGPAGGVMTVEFDLLGQSFTALNGGPMFKFSEAISFQIMCADQAEVDHFWNRLVEGGGEHGPCGWLKDRFGLSWQVVPEALIRLTTSDDSAKSKRVFDAMMKMGKLDIATLEAAAKAA
jgi:predicted 3-demethylubiquinone-9 3-methyltransferase (glyoxalase superfamily)